MGNVLDPVAAAEQIFDRGLVLPPLIVPRRDGLAHGGEHTLDADPDAVSTFRRVFLVNEHRVAWTAKEEGTSADLLIPIREPGFGDLEAMTPQQAAIAAAFLLYLMPQACGPETIADALVAARGVGFAAAAAVEFGGLAVWLRNKNRDIAVLRREGSESVNMPERFALAARVRRHLVEADEARYAAALETVAALRDLDQGARGDIRNATASFLFPERADWIDADISALPWTNYRLPQSGLAAWLLLGAVSTRLQAAALAERTAWDLVRRCPAATATVFATVGTDMVRALDRWISAAWDPEPRQRLMRILAGLDSDECFQMLLGLDHRGAATALLEAGSRYPRRAIRFLAERPEPRPAANRVLKLLVTVSPEAAEDVASELDGEARTRIRALMFTAKLLPAAELSALPPELTSPPWTRERPVPAKPVVVKGLTAPTEAGVRWLGPEERAEWRTDRLIRHADLDSDDWDWLLRDALTLTGRSWYSRAVLIVDGPEEMARTAFANGPTEHIGGHWAKTAVARFEMDTFSKVLFSVRDDPAADAELVLPFACSELAPLVADWNHRLKRVRPIAQAWLRRHPGVAARALIPVALGKAGKARQAAESAIRFLLEDGHGDEVHAAAAGYGPAAEAGIAALPMPDPLYATLPKTMPDLPFWAEPGCLPQLLLKDREEALPAEVVRTVVQMLTVSSPTTPYPLLATVEKACDRYSLAAFAWALFENWQTAEYPSGDSFAFHSLRWFGDDEAVRRLAPLVRAWPGENGHARAVTGLEVMAAIGGEAALIHLYGISQKVKFKGLKDAALAEIEAIAADLGLTREQLGDRLVPDLGLDAAGSLTLDYGPRKFVVGFDEQLRPYVADQSGKRLKSLPKPGAKDDTEPATAAYQRFTGLKKDVRVLAGDQIARLELAMVTRRRWTGAEFESFLIGHPLVRHLTRRLVWADFRPDGTTLRTAFRVAEDAGYADVDDEPVSLPEDALIGVAHPVDLGAEVTRWSEVFADYEILQPFEQLGRRVFTLTAQERESDTLTRFDGHHAPAGRLLGLERRGWRRSDPADAGSQSYLLRDLPEGRTLVLDLDPGFSIGSLNPTEAQQFDQVWIGETKSGYTGYWWHQQEKSFPFSVLDPVTASEILRDLTEVITP